MKLLLFSGFPVVLLMFAGCAGPDALSRGSNPFAPASPLAASVVARWEKELATTDVTAIGTRKERNDLVYRLIFLCDYRFSRYEADLLLGKAARDSFTDLSMFGLNTASTLITPGSTTKMLAAIAGGLGFTRATIEKNFYQNHAAPVLMAKMRALRAEKLNEIVHNLSRSIEAYPASLAVIDVLDYYNRGTMLGALRAISNDTAVQSIKAEGGKVTEPEAAPPISFQIQAGTIAAHSGGDAMRSIPTASSDFGRRRNALGSRVMVLRREKETATAAAILRAGNVEAGEPEAITKLGNVVNNIGTRSELETWERAFAVAPSGPVKTAPPVIEHPIESLTPGAKKPTTFPKTAPPVVPDKSKVEPLNPQ
jgi:hypothetical protein